METQGRGMLKKYLNKPLPEIPGLVYKGNDPKILRASLFALIIGLLFVIQYMDTEEVLVTWSVLIICVIGFIASFFSSAVICTEVTGTTVSAKLMNGREIRSDSLNSYILYIGEGMRAPGNSLSKNYKYGVSLVPKEVMSLDQHGQIHIQHYPRNKNRRRIPLVTDALCPINLREWVESFQKQVQDPLPICFSSVQIASDYETGIFRSKKNLNE